MTRLLFWLFGLPTHLLEDVQNLFQLLQHNPLGKLCVEPNQSIRLERSKPVSSFDFKMLQRKAKAFSLMDPVETVPPSTSTEQSSCQSSS